MGIRITQNGIAAYLERDERPWLHLVDGGISDNLGLRSFYNLFDLGGNLQDTLKSINHTQQ
jgi:NTE family protein